MALPFIIADTCSISSRGILSGGGGGCRFVHFPIPVTPMFTG